MALALTNKEYPPCPACKATYVIKKGKRRNRLRTTPLFQCNECGHRFNGEAGKHKTYPLKTILEAVSTFNLGHSLNETQSILRRRGHLDVPETYHSFLGQPVPSAYDVCAPAERCQDSFCSNQYHPDAHS